MSSQRIYSLFWLERNKYTFIHNDCSQFVLKSSQNLLGMINNSSKKCNFADKFEYTAIESTRKSNNEDKNNKSK